MCRGGSHSPGTAQGAPGPATKGVLFVLRSITEVKQKILALFPLFWLLTEGFEVENPRSASALPRFLTRWPGMARQAGPGKTARKTPARGEKCAQRAH